MMVGLRAGIGLAGLALLVACGSTSTPSTSGTSGGSTSVAALRGVHFLNTSLVWDSSAPINPGGPIMRVSGTVVAGSGAGVDAGVIKAYVLDGGPDRANYPVASIKVQGGAFAQALRVIGPGGHEIRLDYIVNGKVLGSTVVKD